MCVPRTMARTPAATGAARSKPVRVTLRDPDRGQPRRSLLDALIEPFTTGAWLPPAGAHA